MSYLTPQEATEKRNMEEMFGTPGWKLFVERNEQNLEDIKEVFLKAKTSRDIYLLQGQAYTLRQLVNYEAFYEKTAAVIEEEREKTQQLDNDLDNDQRLADADI